MKLITTLILLGISFSVQTRGRYYPVHYKEAFAQKTYRNKTLIKKLFQLLSYYHIKSEFGEEDTLSSTCPPSKLCYHHKILNYKEARKILFGQLHLDEGMEGYFIRDVYCRKKVTAEQTLIGPHIIPDRMILNSEHTWPQSKFTPEFSTKRQLSDLHHLYPVDSRANSVRRNLRFGDPDHGVELDNCDGAYISSESFEPPSEHKGNVARALFYFSVRYQISISREEEETLRRWHIKDPVDPEERKRNHWIYRVQGNRNPFIDYPKLVFLISNF